MKSVVVHICFMLVGVVFALGMAELGFRSYQFLVDQSEVPDDLDYALQRSVETEIEEIGETDSLRGIVHPSRHFDIVYELKPNMRGTFLGKGLETNSFGMRGPEVTLEKPPGTIRIVGLGDSVMFGWGVEQEESFLAVTEQRLRDAGHHVEVLNFGVPGYNTVMEVETFKKRALAFSPDIVVIHFVSNDLDVPHFMYSPGSTRPALLGSRLLGTIAEQFRDTGADDVELLDVATARWDEDMLQNIREEYRHMAGRRAFLQAMRTLARLCNEHEIPLIMLLGAHTRLTREVVAGRMAPRMGFTVLEAKETVDNYFLENFPDANRRDRRAILWVSEQDSHPNALGHQLYADVLTPALMSLLQAD